MLSCQIANAKNIAVTPAIPVNLPQSLSFQGNIYTLRYQYPNTAEYYLNGEQDYGWTKLLTVTYSQRNNLAEYQQSLKSNFAQQQLSYANSTLKGNNLLWQAVFPPVSEDSRFSGYESNQSYNTLNSCGIVGVIYAEHAKPNGDKNQMASIYRNLSQQQASFAKQSEQLLKNVKCK